MPYGCTCVGYGCGDSWGTMSREEGLVIFEKQKRCLDGELDGLRKRI
jgi:hypothetical protein